MAAWPRACLRPRRRGSRHGVARPCPSLGHQLGPLDCFFSSCADVVSSAPVHDRLAFAFDLVDPALGRAAVSPIRSRLACRPTITNLPVRNATVSRKLRNLSFGMPTEVFFLRSPVGQHADDCNRRAMRAQHRRRADDDFFSIVRRHQMAGVREKALTPAAPVNCTSNRPFRHAGWRSFATPATT